MKNATGLSVMSKFESSLGLGIMGVKLLVKYQLTHNIQKNNTLTLFLSHTALALATKFKKKKIY